MASQYLMAYNALLKINPNYEVVAKTCNISSFRIIKDVIIPCSKITIREMIAIELRMPSAKRLNWKKTNRKALKNPHSNSQQQNLPWHYQTATEQPQ